MPVTARLSKMFYDRLGEAVATELVDWLNNVDATSRSELREMIELANGRLEAKMDLKLEQLRSEVQVSLARMETRLEAGLREQTRFFFVAWAALLAAIMPLWFR